MYRALAYGLGIAAAAPADWPGDVTVTLLVAAAGAQRPRGRAWLGGGFDAPKGPGYDA